MRFMRWSWRDYCELPELYRIILIDMINEEAASSRHEAARLAAKQGRL